MHICQVFKRTSPQCFETQARGGGMRGKARMRVVKIREISGQERTNVIASIAKQSLCLLFLRLPLFAIRQISQKQVGKVSENGLEPIILKREGSKARKSGLSSRVMKREVSIVRKSGFPFSRE